MLELRRNQLVQSALCLADLDSVFQGIRDLFFGLFSPFLLQFFKLGLNIGKRSSLLTALTCCGWCSCLDVSAITDGPQDAADGC